MIQLLPLQHLKAIIKVILCPQKLKMHIFVFKLRCDILYFHTKYVSVYTLLNSCQMSSLLLSFIAMDPKIIIENTHQNKLCSRTEAVS